MLNCNKKAKRAKARNKKKNNNQKKLEESAAMDGECAIMMAQNFVGVEEESKESVRQLHIPASSHIDMDEAFGGSSMC